MIQRDSLGRQFSGGAPLEEAERVRHERKPSERFPGACLTITSGLPTSCELIGLVNRSAFSGTNPRNAAQP